MTRAALLSLARTQRRLSHQYRAWAREDERAGKLDAYRRDSAEADRLRASAKWNLKFARRMSEPADERIAA